jgi:hypothetical protein
VSTPRPVLRLCVSHVALPRESCVVPERCEERDCARCGQVVHYDPAASIPALGPELILCEHCTEEVMDVLNQ